MLSVIIPCYNEAANIEECITSIISQSVKVDEIIVVDDASTDDSKKILEKMQAKVGKIKIVSNDKNMGRPYCLNIGIKNSRGEIIGIIDADCRADSEWIKRGVEKLNSYDAVSGPYIAPLDTPIRSAHQIVNDFFANAAKKTITTKITGGNLMVKREVLTEVRFDEGAPYGEDYNFNIELKKRNKKVYYSYDMAVVSLGEPKDLKELFKQRLTQGSTLRYSLKKGLSLGTFARFIYVLTFFAGFLHPYFWIITALPLFLIFMYGLKNFKRYPLKAVFLAPLVAFLRTFAIFLGFMFGRTKVWRQK